jgi:predicted nucleotidyltransferase
MTVTTSEVIDEAVRRLVEVAHPSKIILFGSHARGEATDQSDIDLLVILPDVKERVAETVRLYRSLRGLSLPTDILVYSQRQVEDWGNVAGTVLYPALREGVILYAAG